MTDSIEEFKKLIDKADESELTKILLSHSLGLNESEVQTVSFCFWLVYMAETDLNDAIKDAWETATENSTDKEKELVLKLLNDQIKGPRKLDPSDLQYFSDKIMVYQCFYGEDHRTKLFWQLSDIRNDLSHNRVGGLNYEDESLYELTTKKKLVFDYLSTMSREVDLSSSPFFNSLTDEERKIVIERVNEVREKSIEK